MSENITKQRFENNIETCRQDRLIKENKYILLDVLVCGIAVYFYESCSILASPKGE